MQARFGTCAWQVATDLARAGVVTLDCRVDGLHLGQPLRWRLTARWQSHRRQLARDRAAGRGSWQKRAEDVAARVADSDPGLAAALTGARTRPGLLPVLVHAAEDLAAGRRHDGPRAFSQTYFGHTKARDDVADILTSAGVSPRIIARLGLRRSPYLGLGGPVTLHVDGHTVNLSWLDGPVRLRADQPLQVAVAPGVPVLAVVDHPAPIVIERMRGRDMVPIEGGTHALKTHHQRRS